MTKQLAWLLYVSVFYCINICSITLGVYSLFYTRFECETSHQVYWCSLATVALNTVYMLPLYTYYLIVAYKSHRDNTEKDVALVVRIAAVTFSLLIGFVFLVWGGSTWMFNTCNTDQELWSYFIVVYLYTAFWTCLNYLSITFVGWIYTINEMMKRETESLERYTQVLEERLRLNTPHQQTE